MQAVTDVTPGNKTQRLLVTDVTPVNKTHETVVTDMYPGNGTLVTPGNRTRRGKQPVTDAVPSGNGTHEEKQGITDATTGNRTHVATDVIPDTGTQRIVTDNTPYNRTYDASDVTPDTGTQHIVTNTTPYNRTRVEKYIITDEITGKRSIPEEKRDTAAETTPYNNNSSTIEQGIINFAHHSHTHDKCFVTLVIVIIILIIIFIIVFVIFILCMLRMHRRLKSLKQNDSMEMTSDQAMPSDDPSYALYVSHAGIVMSPAK